MSVKLQALLEGTTENCILPFFWVHGEEAHVLQAYLQAVHACGIGAVCIESRPHPDFCGPKWWEDMDVLIAEAKRLDMKLWILDDSHFPTGYANGALKEAPPELQRQFLCHSAVEVTGPTPSVQLDVARHAVYTPNPMDAGIFGHAQPRALIEGDRLYCVIAARVDGGLNPDTLTDLTAHVRDGQLTWDVPPGRWRIDVLYLTHNAGSRDHYIHMLDAASAHTQIEAVYEPHYARYADDFGTTIAGFFSDEPELGNGPMYSPNAAIGQEQPLPWSRAMEAGMAACLGDDWKAGLSLLWETCTQPAQTARIRGVYMDLVTRLVEENFSKPLGAWCAERGVEYIGHLIEDNNAHTRMGPSLGHFFRGLSGQHMSGIDDIGGQVLPGGEDFPKTAFIGKRDGEFFHYMLGKLGSSAGAIDPNKHGRTMCEIFGAYGWGLGVRDMKYLVDHFLVRGVNRFVPHAFSLKPYPDPDCPPHFYADGHDPQFKHFGALMRYLNRMSALLSDGHHVAPIGLLYNAEAEWMGECMLSQKPAHVLTDRQIDFDILPADILSEPERYRTLPGKALRVNTQTYKAVVVPYAQFLPTALCVSLANLAEAGCPVLFVDGLPEGAIPMQPAEAISEPSMETGAAMEMTSAAALDAAGVASLLSACRVIPLARLTEALDALSVPELSVSPAFPMLRAMHYREEGDVWVLVNESLSDTFEGLCSVPQAGPVCLYDAWNNVLCALPEPVEATPEGGTRISLTLPPRQTMVLVFGDTNGLPVLQSTTLPQSLLLDGPWTLSRATAKEYPQFHGEETVDTFTSDALRHPAFSGMLRYETERELPVAKDAVLHIEDAREAVEVFVNGVSAGIRVAPPLSFAVGHLVKPGMNRICIEVATLLERERAYAPPDPADFMARMNKAPVLQPTGILGGVRYRNNSVTLPARPHVQGG